MISAPGALCDGGVNVAPFPGKSALQQRVCWVQEGLGQHGLFLLERDTKWLVSDVQRLLPYFNDMASGRF